MFNTSRLVAFLIVATSLAALAQDPVPESPTEYVPRSSERLSREIETVMRLLRPETLEKAREAATRRGLSVAPDATLSELQRVLAADQWQRNAEERAKVQRALELLAQGAELEAVREATRGTNKLYDLAARWFQPDGLGTKPRVLARTDLKLEQSRSWAMGAAIQRVFSAELPPARSGHLPYPPDPARDVLIKPVVHSAYPSWNAAVEEHRERLSGLRGLDLAQLRAQARGEGVTLPANATAESARVALVRAEFERTQAQSKQLWEAVQLLQQGKSLEQVRAATAGTPVHGLEEWTKRNPPQLRSRRLRAQDAALSEVSRLLAVEEAIRKTHAQELGISRERPTFAAEQRGFAPARGADPRARVLELPAKAVPHALLESAKAWAESGPHGPAARERLEALRFSMVLSDKQISVGYLEPGQRGSDGRAVTRPTIEFSERLVQELAQAGGGPESRSANRALGLILAHELAHAAGVRGERAADRAALEIFNRSSYAARFGRLRAEDVRLAFRAFQAPAGSSHLSTLVQRMRMFGHGGLRRAAALERAVAGEPDRLAAYRRADGTLDWKRLGGSTALREGGALAHFGLALFLKELAVVAATGDRLRIEEFFDGLMTTDFYKHYGAFVVGARGAEVAYGRYLQRYVRPGFVNGILKTNVTLAVGLALPQLLEGNFEGKTFAISLGSLGLSSAAVRSGVAGIRWVRDLSGLGRGAKLSQRGALLKRLSRAGAWVYTAAELAVVLYVADGLQERVTEWSDARAARRALGESAARALQAAGAPGADPEAIQQAGVEYAEAWDAYRAFLSRPIARDEALLQGRLESLARKAKLLEDRRALIESRLDGASHLRASLERRSGSLEAYAEQSSLRAAAKLQEKVDLALESYERSRSEHARQLNEEGLRRGQLLEASLQEALAKVEQRGDLFARKRGERQLASFAAAHRQASANRPQTYSDQLEGLDLLIARAEAAGGTSDYLREVRQRIVDVQRADAALSGGSRTGLAQELQGAR